MKGEEKSGWLGPWVVTLAVTSALLALTLLLSGAFMNYYVSFIPVGASSIWAAWDSRRIRIQRYRSQMANEPVIILFMCAMLWLLFFPWYLVIRQGIRRGLVPLKDAA